MINKRGSVLVATIAALTLQCIFSTTEANAQLTIQAPYSSSYTSIALGSISGLPGNYGGLLFKAGNPNTLYAVGASESSAATIYSIGVVRGAGGHVTGFTGSAASVATSPGSDGGLAYAPNGTFLFEDYSSGICEIPVGSTTTTKTVTVPGSSR